MGIADGQPAHRGPRRRLGRPAGRAVIPGRRGPGRPGHPLPGAGRRRTRRANLYRRTATAQDARRIARRFLSFEDLILRFATGPDLDIFTNNEAGRTIRPVKVQQRSSGGSWRTLTGLANFAVVASYLSTAAKWGISTLDALRSLFNGHAWLSPALNPAG